ncbi:MAG: alpha/beta fold hydrolase [Clostridia bacterium]|nr:MAG: alpha/beta fold hydrolase [Clostridia bacterium]
MRARIYGFAPPFAQEVATLALDESQLHCQQIYFPNGYGHLLYGELFLPAGEAEARVARRHQQVDENSGEAEARVPIRDWHSQFHQPRTSIFRVDPHATVGGTIFPPLTSIFRAGVVLTHGFRAGPPDWERSRYLARRLSGQGAAVLCFDYRGVGQSQGEMREAGLTNYALDLGAAVSHLLSFVSQVVVVAHSFGGQVAMARAAEDPRIAAVCTLGTPRHSLPIFQQVLSPERYAELVGGAEIRFADRYGSFPLRPGFHYDLVRYNMIELVPRIAPRPLLLVYAGADNLTPLTEGYDLLAAAGEPKALEIVAGADHFFSRRQHREALAATIEHWLARIG